MPFEKSHGCTIDITTLLENEVCDEKYHILFTKSFPVPSNKLYDIEPFFKFL
jgi:uncharacterized protein YfcZ (UPF0381/DUF406 family)